MGESNNMKRPDNIINYSEIDLKLGIKSSLPNAKSTLALLILLWESSDKPAELAYSQQKNDGIILDNKVEESLIATLKPLYSTVGISDETFISKSE